MIFYFILSKIVSILKKLLFFILKYEIDDDKPVSSVSQYFLLNKWVAIILTNVVTFVILIIVGFGIILAFNAYCKVLYIYKFML